MPDPATLRDSTQIVLPVEALEDIRAVLEAEFMVTVFVKDGTARIIGSPVVIKEVNQFLVRHGVSLP
jgi:hypothetical protein